MLVPQLLLQQIRERINHENWVAAIRCVTGLRERFIEIAIRDLSVKQIELLYRALATNDIEKVSQEYQVSLARQRIASSMYVQAPIVEIEEDFQSVRLAFGYLRAAQDFATQELWIDKS